MLIVYEPKTNQELSVIRQWLDKKKYVTSLNSMSYEVCVDVERRAYLFIPKKYDGLDQFTRPINLSGFVRQVRTLELKLGITT